MSTGTPTEKKTSRATDRPETLRLERLQELGFLRHRALLFILELLGQLL